MPRRLWRRCRAKPKPARSVFTYQTRLRLTPEQDAALAAWAELQGRAERRLFALRTAEARGRPVPMEATKDGKLLPVSIKRRIMAEFGLTGRQFNAVERQLDARVDAIRERRPGLIEEGERRIAKARALVAKLARERPGSNALPGKTRRLLDLERAQAALLADEADGRVRLGFGSKRLFRAQFALAENGYADLDAWRADGRAARADQITLLGSGDEVCGNQTAQARLAPDGTLALTFKLPEIVAAQVRETGAAALDRFGRLTVPGLRFAYGHEQILGALATSQRVLKTVKPKKNKAETDSAAGAGAALNSESQAEAPVKTCPGHSGTAISYRLIRDAKGWRVLASLEVPAPQIVTAHANGALGLDINVDHLALAEIDASGNAVAFARLDLPLRQLNANPARAVIEEAALWVAARARDTARPLVVEILDLSRRKAELEGVDPRLARKISGMAYAKVQSALRAACFRLGVEGIAVNPALSLALVA